MADTSVVDRTTPAVPLFERLPEIYRERDAAQVPEYRLRSFLGLVERMFGEVHADIEGLYHNLFIDTCDDWVIPYLADLLGVSHLSGDPWTLRADVANAVPLRRRKGTLGAIELLTYSLTQWGVHTVELYRGLAWAQNVNHQRPDAGGRPPYSDPAVDRYTPVRGGTAVLRDPATLSLVGTPFDPLARTADVRVPVGCEGPGLSCAGSTRYNLPNLGIFLWRLETPRVHATTPVWVRTGSPGLPGAASRAVCFEIDPLGTPVRLFNVSRFERQRRDMRRAFRFHLGRPPAAVDMDDAPGPILAARLDSVRPPRYEGETAPAAPEVGALWHGPDDSWSVWTGATDGWRRLDDPASPELMAGTQGDPSRYVSLDVRAANGDVDFSDRALQLHLPRAGFQQIDPGEWRFRGANLCAWEQGLKRSLGNLEIAIDPVLGRVMFGVSAAQAAVLQRDLRVTYTYGTVGAIGAHPAERSHDRSDVDRPAATHVVGTAPAGAPATPVYVASLAAALQAANGATVPMVVEIRDSNVHDLDLANVDTEPPQQGGPNLRLGASITIRAGDGERPIVRLARPLRIRPAQGVPAGGLDARLEGLFLTRGAGFPAGEPLIARAALNALVLSECTLDPGGRWTRDRETREPIWPGIRLGAADPAQFRETPTISVLRTITGPLRLGGGYRLCLADSIVDAGRGIGEGPVETDGWAISGAGADPGTDWGPETAICGVTFFGRVRVESLEGRGGLWLHRLEVLNNQIHCVKYSYFSGDADRLPQNHACVFDDPATRRVRLRFTSEAFGDPGYGQLSIVTDRRLRERGPDDDAMGAFGFLREAHKWRNIQIRYREFMPVGVRPLLVPVT